MRFFILVCFLPTLANAAVNCAEKLRDLSPVQVNEFAKENAAEIWKQIDHIDISSPQRLAMSLALAEKDPKQTARRFSELKLGPSQAGQVVLKLAQTDAGILAQYP